MRVDFFSIFLTILIMVMVITAFWFPPRSEIFPITVGVIALAFLLIDLIHKLLRKREKKPETSLREKFRAIGEEQEKKPISLREEFKAIGWVFLILIPVPFLFGFQIGLPVIITLFLKFYGKYSWKKSILYGILAGAIVYLFSYAFQIVFPRGFLEYLG
jgi:uncharacterized membrane protein